MTDKLTDEQTQAILKVLDESIATGPWEASNFLRVIGKNLREIREKFASNLSEPEDLERMKIATNLARTQALEENHQEIFISLYSVDGSNLQSWERILANLPRQIISRPIYPNEAGVKNLIKVKENKVNEAYVSIYINRADILQVAGDKIPLDKFGKPLLSIKDRALNMDHVNRFVHLSGTYDYIKGRLIKNDAAS